MNARSKGRLKSEAQRGQALVSGLLLLAVAVASLAMLHGVGRVVEARMRLTHAADAAVGIEVGGNAALFKGDYKLTHVTLPWGDAKWHLYHLTEDPGETRDLSTQDPQRFKSMLADYESYAKTMGVLKLPDDFNPQKQVAINALKKQLEILHVKIIAPVVLLLAIAAFFWWRRRASAKSERG